MVLDKAAGTLSQGDASGDPSIVDFLRDYLGRSYVGMIHRLDRNTSGLMVVAKRTKAARRLTEALREGTLERTYLALVRGKLQGKQQWTGWLTKDAARNEACYQEKKTSGAKAASLRVEAVRSFRSGGEWMTLASFRLETGRSHQIRVQCAANGFPVAGDLKYGGETKGGTGKKISRPALHSHTLSFPHPMSGEILFFESPLPEDISRLLDSKK